MERLLTVDQIAEQLNQYFCSDLEDDELDLSDLVLHSQAHDIDANLRALERNLNLVLPETFKQLNRAYDLSQFTLGNISFGFGGHYLQSIQASNQDEQFSPWWQGDARPQSRILIAAGDPFAVIMDCESHNIYALDSSGQYEHIATDFDLFFRGMGSVVLGHVSSLEACLVVGFDQERVFWNEVRLYPKSA